MPSRENASNNRLVRDNKVTWSLIEHVTGNRAVYKNAWKELISEYFSWKENRRRVM